MAKMKTIAKKMLAEKVSSFLVVKGGSVIGNVTHRDLLGTLINLIDQPANQVLLKNIQELFYKKHVGEIVNTLAQAGV